MKCVICGNDSGKGRTCSSRCRQVLRRKCDKTSATKCDNVTVSECDTSSVTSPVEQLTRKQLKAAIDSYPEDTWKDSPEYKELIRRLHTMTVEELEADGYWIPSWKVSAGAATIANTPACAPTGAKP